VLNRNYIFYLQHKVAELEEELEQTTDQDSLDFVEAGHEKAKSREVPAPASPAAIGDLRDLLNVDDSH
jgi:hypothetical protein